MCLTRDYDMWYNGKVMCVAKVGLKEHLIELVLWDTNFRLHKWFLGCAKFINSFIVGRGWVFSLCDVLMMWKVVQNFINPYFHIKVRFLCFKCFCTFLHT